ncbi:hypothetical protein AADG42_09340 [Ammonicoccus fulvus]|uniref:Uncharacterized protein n=1 Tax=Ammonicoccus fulvus TaxID=3138240 RepID=A0ABZ3FRV9_9ACTN
MTTMLVIADAFLSAATPGRVRQTCWLARRGLEQVVDRLVVARAEGMEDASMTSKLVALQVLYVHTRIPALAWHSWHALSRACHQHAYELSPTYAEVRGWLEDVHELAAEAYAAEQV